MALGPEDLGLTETEIHEVDKLEPLIDADLLAQYTNYETVYVRVDPMSKRIQNELVRRYKAVGWSEVSFTHDKDQNSAIEFKP